MILGKLKSLSFVKTIYIFHCSKNSFNVSQYFLNKVNFSISVQLCNSGKRCFVQYSLPHLHFKRKLDLPLHFLHLSGLIVDILVINLSELYYNLDCI